MADLEFDASEVIAAMRRYERAEPIVRRGLTGFMTRVLIIIQRGARGFVSVDRGILRNSIAFQVQSTGQGVVGRVGSNQPHARTVEEGRRAGSTMPPIAAIAGWLARHGGDVSAAFVVARAIARRGIPARPYLRKAFTESIPRINREFADEVKRILAAVAGGR